MDAINDTMADFYNDTDLFSGEFLAPPSVHLSNLELQTPASYPLTLTL